MEVLVGVVGKLAELTVIPIGRHMGYLLFYEENFKKLKDKSVELETRKVRIAHDVERERRNGREIQPDVVSWLKRVDETLEEVKKLCGDQAHDGVRCWKCSFPNLKSRHQLGRKAKKMTFVIGELKENGRFDDGVGYVAASSTENLILATSSSEKLESRNLVKKEVILSLTNPKVSKVGIYGWGGVGKTTFAKEVAKHVKGEKLFDVVVIATISQTLDVKRVQDEISYQLGLHLDENHEMASMGRADRLCARIKKENYILIILDDLWEKIDLDKLGIPSEQHHKGCKLLVTSRSLDTLQKNDTQRNFFLKTLNIAESWRLFEDIVGDAVKDANLKEIATQVVERCVGMPVMIVSIAKSLKYNKNIHYWKDALKNLKRVDNGDVYGSVFSAFEFTYERLKNDEMKKVFLLCGAEGPSIYVSDLLKYVIGLGILKHTNTIEDARDRLYRIIEDLRASCFLLEDDESDDIHQIKMHDLVCEIAVSIAKMDELVFVLKNKRIQDWPSLERCTQLILKLCYIQELPQNLNCPNLKFFLLISKDNRTLKIPDFFFEGMKSLEVLDLTGLIISTLPKSLVSLAKLRTLCLDQCILENIDGIGSLINLEILSFGISSMKELPSEIGQLTRLRMLDLSRSGIEIIPPNTLSKLTNIEELHMGNASIKWKEESSTKENNCASLVELGCLTSLTTLEIQIREAWMLPRDMMFAKLERYKIVIGDKWEWPHKVRTSRLLKLKLDTNIHLEHKIKALIRRVEDLYLDEVNGISDVLFDLNGEGFPLLKNLHVQNNGQVQHIINTMERWHIETHVLFPELETLTLHNMNNLVNISYGPLPVNSFRKLTVIRVKRCDRLMYLFSVSMVKALSQLVEVEVEECNSMKRIVLIENEDDDIYSDEKIEFDSLRSLSVCHLPLIHDFCSDERTSLRTNVPAPLFDGIKVKFSSLETLKLSSINIEKIWDDNHIFASNLSKLIVEDCRGLKYLFSSSLIASLLKLKHLEISKCENMEAIIATEDINNIASQDKVQFLKLENVVIKDMKSLKKVWHHQFEGIKSLEVSNCEKLVNIFPSDAQGMFGNFKILRVGKCANLKYVFSPSLCQELRQLEELDIESCGVVAIVASEEGFEELNFYFPMLRIFRLACLMQLNDFYPKTYTLECPSLKVLNVALCEALQIFAFGHLDSKQALFHIEKVSENLEQLSLNEKDAMRILKGNYKEKSFQKIKILRLQYFQESPINFLNELLERFPSAAMLQARWSSFDSFDSLFPAMEICHSSIEKPTQIKHLWFFQLEQLEHIWSDDDSASHPLVPNLEILSIWECCRLRRLAPPSTSFTNLTTLDVADCNGLKYFMSTFTAKSLIHLTHLKVRNCGMLEEIVMTDEGGPEEEIIFKSLEALELTCLSSFKSFCFEKHTFIFPSLVTLKVKGCQKLEKFSSGVIVARFLKLVEVENEKKHWKGDLNTAINQLFIEKTNEHLNVGTSGVSSFEEQVGQTKPNQIADTKKQESQKHVNDRELQNERPLVQITPNNSSSSSTNKEPMDTTEALSSKEQVREPKGLTWGTQEKGEKIDMPSIDKAAKVIRDYDKDVNDTIEKPLIQTGEQVQRTTAGEDLEESHESRTSPKEDSFNHPKTFETKDKIETIGTHEIQDAMGKPLIRTDQDAEKLALVQNSEKFGTEKISNTIEKSTILVAQDVSNSTKIPKAAIDPSLSKASDLLIPPMQKSNIYRSYQGMIDILKQNIPYLEDGVNRHPQVLDWLNTNKQRVLASSSFSLFAEVTRILRTTRRSHFLEDDRTYIRKCCAVLEVVGFDASWLSYVYNCIEECGDDAEDIKRKIEETKGQASNLKTQLESIKKELTSVEDSLALLLNKASRLDEFFES